MEKLQLELRETTARTSTCHYRRAFAEAGVTPDDLRSLADLALPVPDQGGPARELPVRHVRGPARAGPPGAREQRHHRKPTVVGYTAEDLDTWSELMARSIRAAGGRPGDLVHVAYGYGLFTGGLGAHYGRAARLLVVPVSGDDRAAGPADRRLPAAVVMATPSYFLAILDEMQAQGVDPRSTSVEVGIFGAEP